MGWPLSGFYRMLPLEGYETAEAKDREGQGSGFNPDMAEDAGHNVFLHHLLAAINERRAGIRLHCPRYYGNNTEFSEAEWNAIWRPLTWADDFEDVKRDNVALLDRFRRAIVRPEVPTTLSFDTAYVGLFHSCRVVDDPTEGNYTMDTTHALAFTAWQLIDGLQPGLKERYAYDDAIARGLFGPTNENDDDGLPLYGWYIGKDESDNPVYARDMATGQSLLGNAPFKLSAQHFNELVMALNLCNLVNLPGCVWQKSFNGAEERSGTVEALYNSTPEGADEEELFWVLVGAEELVYYRAAWYDGSNYPHVYFGGLGLDSKGYKTNTLGAGWDVVYFDRGEEPTQLRTVVVQSVDGESVGGHKPPWSELFYSTTYEVWYHYRQTVAITKNLNYGYTDSGITFYQPTTGE